MQLLAFVKAIYLPSRVELSSGYATNLLAVVARFSKHIGRSASLDDLTVELVGSYLSAYRKRWTATSANNQRRMLFTLWQAAYDHMLIQSGPRRSIVRSLPVDHRPPRAWDVEQIGQLIYTASQWPGMVGDVPAVFWWPAIFATLYWSACRIGAMLTARSEDYDGQSLLVCHQKNGRSQIYTLPESCCQLIDATQPGGRILIFDWPHCRRHFFSVARRIIEAAGLPCPKVGRSLLHTIRRSSLSYCAAADPAIAQRQAGHADYRTTLTHYVDPSIAGIRSAADVIPDPLAATPTPRLRLYG